MKKISRKQKSEFKELNNEEMFAIRGGKEKVERPKTPNGSVVTI